VDCSLWSPSRSSLAKETVNTPSIQPHHATKKVSAIAVKATDDRVSILRDSIRVPIFFFVGAVLYAIVLIVSIPPAEGVDYDDALTKLRDRLTIGLQLPDDAVEREEPTNTRGLRGK
jgi:hypothetical protein